MTTHRQSKPPAPSENTGTAEAAAAVVKAKPNVKRGKTTRQTTWKMATVPVAERRLYAAALVYHNNISAAFNEVFAERFPATPKATVHYYGRQLNADPVVKQEVQNILDARTDAKIGECRDLKRLAIEAVANLSRMIKADHDAICAALLGKPVDAIYDLPDFARGVIAEYTVREKSNAEVIISGIKLHDPKKANEIMQKWVAFSQRAVDTGYTAQSLPVDVFAEDGAQGGGAVRRNTGGNGEVGAEDIG